MMTTPLEVISYSRILAMVAPAHLDNNHDLAKLAVDAYVPEPDNVIGEKGNRVGTERGFRERLVHLPNRRLSHSGQAFRSPILVTMPCSKQSKF